MINFDLIIIAAITYAPTFLITAITKLLKTTKK